MAASSNRTFEVLKQERTFPAGTIQAPSNRTFEVLKLRPDGLVSAPRRPLIAPSKY